MMTGQKGKVRLIGPYLGQENWVQAQTLPQFPGMTEKLLGISGINLKYESFALDLIP